MRKNDMKQTAQNAGKVKIGLIIGMMLMTVGVITACQSNKVGQTPAETAPVAASAFPMTLTDGSGAQITFDKLPEVVVSLSPAATETVFAIGRGDVLKGRTDYCNYPAEAASVPSMGSIMEPNIEAIVAAKPDVVFVSDMFSTDLRAKMEGMGIKVFDLSSHDRFDGVYTAIENAGKILDVTQASEQLISDMKTTVADVQAKVKDAKPVTAYYVVGYGETGDYTAGKNTFIDQIITMAGGTNAANDVEGWSYSLEKLIEKDPTYLICRGGGEYKSGIEAANGYKSLTAVKEGRLIEIESELLDIQGPRSAQGVLALAKIIHPEIFK